MIYIDEVNAQEVLDSRGTMSEVVKQEPFCWLLSSFSMGLWCKLSKRLL